MACGRQRGRGFGFPGPARRNARAAKKLMVKMLKRQGFVPTRIVTDRLRSYTAAFRSLGLTAIHDRGLRANNRAENSHQPVRRREHKQQRFLAVHAATYNTFYHQRHLLNRTVYKDLRASSFDAWACASVAA
jgi:putative transposase